MRGVGPGPAPARSSGYTRAQPQRRAADATGAESASPAGQTAAPTGDKGGPDYAAKAQNVKEKHEKQIKQADRDAAAARKLQQGALNPLMLVEPEAAAAAAPGDAPRYFSHPNYANSPLPEVTTTPGATISGWQCSSGSRIRNRCRTQGLRSSHGGAAARWAPNGLPDVEPGDGCGWLAVRRANFPRLRVAANR